MSEAQYSPGPWVGMASADTWLVADLDQRDPVIADCWALVAAGASVERLLATLRGAQLRPVLDLAILRCDSGGTEVVVCGAAWAEVTKPDGQVVQLLAVAGERESKMVDQFEELSLCLPHDVVSPPPALVLGSGVVLVSRIVIRAARAAAIAPPVAQARELGTADRLSDELEALGGRFDDLFGMTTLPTEDEATQVGIPMEWMAGMPEAPEVSQMSEVPVEPNVLYCDVSWAKVSDGPMVTPDPYERHHEEHPALAIPQPPPSISGGIDPELLRTTKRAPSTPTAIGPMVEAVRCVTGHANPPDIGRCRICGDTITPQAVQRVPRPRLGVLRLSTGEVVPLDRGVIIGRAPGAPDGFGHDEPYRIQLASPDGSISRKHIEIVLKGWTVSVVDLKSTNGTQVIPPGGISKQMPPGGSQVIENGWIVNLDDMTSFRFEVTE